MPVECFFLDVGQGTSHVILLGNGRAIVLDGGPEARIPLALLDRYVTKVVALIVSHNDADHHRGAIRILEQYRGSIEKLYFLQDRPLDHIGLYRLAQRLSRVGAIQCCRLERNNQPRIFYEDLSGVGLEILFPDFLGNLDAQETEEPNSTSGILALFCGSRRIVFAADAPISAWQRIHDLKGALFSDVLAVSHHGGAVWPPRKQGEAEAPYESRVLEGLRWLYTQACPCAQAVISVGTSNTYNHPHEWVVRTLRQTGAIVLCTQITRHCCGNLEEIRLHGVRPLTVPSRSVLQKDVLPNGQSRNVACAGTVVAEIGTDSVRIQHLTEHQSGVDTLAGLPSGHPLCRKV